MNDGELDNNLVNSPQLERKFFNVDYDSDYSDEDPSYTPSLGTSKSFNLVDYTSSSEDDQSMNETIAQEDDMAPTTKSKRKTCLLQACECRKKMLY